MTANQRMSLIGLGVAIGLTGSPALQEVLENKPSLEVHCRVEQLLAKAKWYFLPRKELQTWRAMEVLEHIGTPEAWQLLTKLANGAPGHRITREAGVGLLRLAKREPSR